MSLLLLISICGCEQESELFLSCRVTVYVSLYIRHMGIMATEEMWGQQFTEDLMVCVCVGGWV